MYWRTGGEGGQQGEKMVSSHLWCVSTFHCSPMLSRSATAYSLHPLLGRWFARLAAGARCLALKNNYILDSNWIWKPEKSRPLGVQVSDE